MMSSIYTSRHKEPKSIFYPSLLPNLERQELITWRFSSVLVAQGGSVTFERCPVFLSVYIDYCQYENRNQYVPELPKVVEKRSID